jgi:hypothetical protein
MLLRSDQSYVVNFWFNAASYITNGFANDGFLRYFDVNTGHGYQWYFDSIGQLRGLVSSGANYAGTNSDIIPLNTWKMITLYLRNANAYTTSVYIDGVLSSAQTTQYGTMNLTRMGLELTMGATNTVPGGRWNDFRMYLDDGVTPDQLYAAQKVDYISSISGVIDYTGLGQPGIFLKSANNTFSSPLNQGSTSFNSPTYSGISTTLGTANVTPPYMTIGASGSIQGQVSIGLSFTNYVHIAVWVKPTASANGNLFTFTDGVNGATITLSINSSNVFSGSVVKGGFTRDLTGVAITMNEWTMLSISVVLANTQVCYLSKDGVALNGGGATGGGSTSSSMQMNFTMANSTNLRFNQLMVVRDADFTPSSLYRLTRTSYGRL